MSVKVESLPKTCKCGGELVHTIAHGRVFSYCKRCTPIRKIKLPS